MHQLRESVSLKLNMLKVYIVTVLMVYFVNNCRIMTDLLVQIEHQFLSCLKTVRHVVKSLMLPYAI